MRGLHGMFTLAGLSLLVFASPAHADLTICNKTPAPVIFAVAFETTQDLVSQGWWTIMPNQCQIAISTPLDRQFYYQYAISHELKVEWRGNFNFCTSDDNEFRITGAQSCEQRNYHTTGFRQIDVGDNKNYTLNIRSSDSPPTANPAPASAPDIANPPAVVAPATGGNGTGGLSVPSVSPLSSQPMNADQTSPGLATSPATEPMTNSVTPPTTNTPATNNTTVPTQQ